MTSLARQAIRVAFSRWALNLCNFVTFVGLARLLTSEEFGAYGLFTSGIFLAEAAGNLGLRQANAHQIGQKRLTDGGALGASLLVWPISGTLSGLALWWAMPAEIGDRAMWLVPTILASLAVVLTSLCQGVFLGRGQIKLFSAMEVLPRVLVALAVVVVALLNQVSLDNQVWIFVACFGAAALFGVVNARPQEGRPLIPSLGNLLALIRSGWPFALMLFLTMLNTRVSTFLLTAQMGPAEAGQYYAALRLNELALQVAASVGLVLFSHGARSADPKAAMRQAAQVTRWLIWGTVLVSIVAILLASLLIPLLLGHRYQSSVPTLQLLLIALPFASLNKVLAPTLSGVGRPLLAAMILVPAVLLNAALSYALTIPFGVPGAGAGLGISQALIAVALVVVASRLSGLSPLDFLLPRPEDLAGVRSSIERRLGRRRLPLPTDEP